MAERIEYKNQIKYSEGLASSFDLRQAQTQLYAAQQEYLQSIVEVLLKRKNLMQSLITKQPFIMKKQYSLLVLSLLLMACGSDKKKSVSDIIENGNLEELQI